MLGGDPEEPDVRRDRCTGALGAGHVAERAGLRVVGSRKLDLDGERLFLGPGRLWLMERKRKAGSGQVVGRDGPPSYRLKRPGASR
jgi:hypothetical protein